MLRVRERDAETHAPLAAEEMRAFLCDAVTLVHRHTRALATAGVCRWSGLPLVRGVGLDVYGVGWPADEAELRSAVSDLRLDRPLLLSAFPGTHPRRSIKTLLDAARCSGYGGAFVWSVLRRARAREPGRAAPLRASAGVPLVRGTEPDQASALSSHSSSKRTCGGVECSRRPCTRGLAAA